MKIFLTLVLAAIIGIGLLVVSPILIGQSQAYAQADTSNQSVRIIPNEYIIQLEEDTPENFVQKQADIVNDTIAAQGGNVTRVLKNLKVLAVEGITNPFVLLNNQSNASAIKTIEPNKILPELAQYVPTGIIRAGISKSPGADVDGRESRPNVDIAVVDSGIWPGHPDLNIFKRVNFLPSDWAGDGYNYHGTHVAGSCCAKDNLGGVVSASPGARVWGLAVCAGHNNQMGAGFRGCNAVAILNAWDYVVSNAASIEVATNSLGGGTMSSTWNNAITAMWNAGVTVLVAAGNDEQDTEGTAFCSATDVICVSALSDFDGKCGGKDPTVGVRGEPGSDDGLKDNLDDRRAGFSNYGSEVDIMAPGVSILSTFPGGPDFTTVGRQYIGASEQGNYASISGTSMATPIAAGVAGLIKTLNPSFTPSQVKSSMQTNAISQTLACDTATNKGGLVQGANSGSSEKILWAGNY